MSKRLEILSPHRFATFCIVVLEESERRGDVIEEDELYDLALGLTGENSLQAEAFCVRFHGFIEMSFRPEAENYVSSDSGKMMFHPALFEVAACARTRKNGRFPDRPFFKRVAELAAGKYRDFEFDAG
ncbi:hypothetical protein [Haliea sp.]